MNNYEVVYMFETGGFHKKVYQADSMYNADKACSKEYPNAQVIGVNLIPKKQVVS